MLDTPTVRFHPLPPAGHVATDSSTEEGAAS
jgi:hypothetical protein